MDIPAPSIVWVLKAGVSGWVTQTGRVSLRESLARRFASEAEADTYRICVGHPFAALTVEPLSTTGATLTRRPQEAR